MLLTETAYVPGMNLPSHSHGSSHLAILLEGSYLERTRSRSYLCLPGDAVHYAVDVQHSNLFGRKLSRCLNLEFPEGKMPEDCRQTRNCVPTEIRSLIGIPGLKLGNGSWLPLARKMIDASPATSLTPLAEELAVHPSHLAKAFRRAFGMSVGQYVLLRRARLGARLLIETNVPVAEIAYDCGFFDQSHFSNAFLRLTGFTPTALRHCAWS